MYAVCSTGEDIWKAFFAFDRQSERWALPEILTVQGRVEPHRSRSTLTTLLQPISAMAVL